MRSPFTQLPESVIRDVVVDAWPVTIDELEYFPEGGGSYHWIARGDRQRWFVTCDDLDTKPWLGDDRDSVFAALLRAYRAAIDLHEGGAGFVARAEAARSGAPAVRVDDRYSVSVFRFVEGFAGRWGSPLPPGTPGDVVTMLATLHRRAVDRRSLPARGLAVAGRLALEEALDDLVGPWDGGPLSEPARREVAAHADHVVRALEQIDQLASEVDVGSPVVTHGEPHPGNLVVTDTGLVLVDWDTVAFARPERDMWMFAESPTLIARYEALTDVRLDPDALTGYRLSWALNDVASFVAQLRGEHRRQIDEERALVALRRIFSGEEPSPYGAPLLTA